MAFSLRENFHKHWENPQTVFENIFQKQQKTYQKLSAKSGNLSTEIKQLSSIKTEILKNCLNCEFMKNFYQRKSKEIQLRSVIYKCI